MSKYDDSDYTTWIVIIAIIILYIFGEKQMEQDCIKAGGHIIVIGGVKTKHTECYFK